MSGGFPWWGDTPEVTFFKLLELSGARSGPCFFDRMLIRYAERETSWFLKSACVGAILASDKSLGGVGMGGYLDYNQ